MNLSHAKALIRGKSGYRVHYEERKGGMLEGGYFPDRDEPTLDDLEEAWKLAIQFARVDPERYVNVYVVFGHDWTPVHGYEERKLNTYPATPNLP